MVSNVLDGAASWKKAWSIEYVPMSEEEDEARMDAMYRDMIGGKKEELLKLQAVKLKPVVFSDSSPTPREPFKFFSPQIFTHAYDAGIISPWDIQFYRKLSRLSHVSKKQMIHKVRIDLLIRGYFSNL